jgi:hypothetical protein
MGTLKCHPRLLHRIWGSTQFHGMKIVQYLLRLALRRASSLIIKKQTDPCRAGLIEIGFKL